MSQVTVHVHLAYVLNGRFQLTVQSLDDPTHPMIEVMSAGDLLKSIRAMKPGSKTIRIGKQTIQADAGLPDGVRAYFQKVYDGYMQAKADGRDLDAELRALENNLDPTDGSGGLSLN